MDKQQIILQHLQEELNDVINYMNAFRTTSDGIFRDLAHDEYSHAKILKSFYTGDSESYKALWKQAESQLE